MIKYLTQAEVKKRAKYKIAEIGSVFAPIKRFTALLQTIHMANGTTQR
jgi:hypothetical protein